LLRVLETGEFEPVGSSKTVAVDVRVISATNARIDEEVAAGRFREDLLYRLNTVELRLPPLRERIDDVAPLAMHFLHTHARKYRKAAVRFDTAAMQLMHEYPWPGNVRELDHAVERGVLMAHGDVIHVDDLALRESRSVDVRFENMTLHEVEAILIRKALDRSGGNVKQAARELGLSRSGLYRRMDKYGLAHDG